MSQPSHSIVPAAANDPERLALRRQLLAERLRFTSSPGLPSAQLALTGHLANLLGQLEPKLLGSYWPIQGEFNASAAVQHAGTTRDLALALPFARRVPASMHYRAWDGRPPTGRDECGLPAPADGADVVPDVVLVPCLGYTRSGYRLGYGGGYFDRWLGAHPEVTSIGIAWTFAELGDEHFASQRHDCPMTLLLTEQGVVA